MSFSKCSNLEAINVIHFKLAIKEIEARILTSNKQNLANKAGFYAYENYN